MHFYDLLSDISVNLSEELGILKKLFTEEPVYFQAYEGRPLVDYVDTYCFRSFSFRGTCLNCEELLKKIGITQSSFFSSNASIELLIVYSEFLLAVILEGKLFDKTNRISEQAATIYSNIEHFCEKMNYEFHDISYGSPTPQYILVEKDKLTSEAIELIEDKETALSCIEYNHHSLRGDLKRKKSILNALAQYIEPILNSKALGKNNYSQLESDMGFVLNNLHIRHNNKDGTKENEYIKNISDLELEEWYDKAYRLLLSVIVNNDNINTHRKISELKEHYVFKT